MNVGIITVSDRASAGEYEDLGGPALREASGHYGWTVTAEAVVQLVPAAAVIVPWAT